MLRFFGYVYLLFLASTGFSFAQEVYTVKSGDTLANIARTFEVSVADLVAANNLANPDQIEVSQELIIPSNQSWEDTLPAPFLEVALEPLVATQGEVQVLVLSLAEHAELTVSYLDKLLPSSEMNSNDGSSSNNMGKKVIFLPTPVLQALGRYVLQLSASSQAGTSSLRLPIEVVAGSYETENITLSATTSQLLDPAIVSREHALLTDTCAVFEPERYWQGVFVPPIANPEYTSVFGTKRSYNGGPVSGFHRGQDFRAGVGTPVLAAANGRVSLAETLQLYGNTIIINHGLGVCSAYMHLSELNASVGQALNAGDLLGLAGSTGLATGPHLHFEIRVDGVPVAPVQWFEKQWFEREWFE